MSSTARSFRSSAAVDLSTVPDVVVAKVEEHGQERHAIPASSSSRHFWHLDILNQCQVLYLKMLTSDATIVHIWYGRQKKFPSQVKNGCNLVKNDTQKLSALLTHKSVPATTLKF